ncbi:polysaccharide biosynthesis protein [Salinimicrobium marinum]|uniref:Polysaccharide biosynthesis protein n=1 Tax=Salinimicrobium marinum TaxID=680283 RepID=A0A918S9Y0_9FLAO|nr:polysaccharide biosynthesis/export family protein [Salinimicrobium marinum]GHA30408.1 polysaccharide biosynthesis protein [Salinimicrobium marinum]
MKNIFLIIIVIISLSSCATKDEIVYFQNLEKLDDMEAIEHFEPRIEVNDVLDIQVSSFNEDLAAPFQFQVNRQSGGGGGSAGQNRGPMGYIVEVDGTIKFPVLGNLNVEGQTRRELETFLTEELKEYVTDVVVRVRIINFRITVLGETGTSVVQVPNERITMPELIAMAGDISYNGKRENILVIRDHDGKKSYGRVDLTDVDIFENPYYFLKQNDIVYVEPTYRTVKSAGFINSWQGLVSIFTTALSLVILFTR